MEKHLFLLVTEVLLIFPEDSVACGDDWRRVVCMWVLGIVCLHGCVFGFGTVCVRLTVQAFTVVLREHREGDLL